MKDVKFEDVKILLDDAKFECNDMILAQDEVAFEIAILEALKFANEARQ